MKDLTRRVFMKQLGAIAALVATPLKSLRAIELNLDWDEAIKEDNLREEVSSLMKKYDVFLFHIQRYFNTPVKDFEDVRVRMSRVEPERVKGYNIPFEVLSDIKEHLKKCDDGYKLDVVEIDEGNDGKDFYEVYYRDYGFKK